MKIILLLFITALARECPEGYFKLPNMKNCKKLLNCNQLNKIFVNELIGVGGVKAVYKATWENKTVALSLLNNPKYIDDFHHGQKMLITYSGIPGFIRLIGYCKTPAITVTEYHEYGSIANLSTIIPQFHINDNIKIRLNYCLNWAKILQVIHGENEKSEIRVMCDSNSIKKLLSQILLDKNLNLILNDLDALPLVDNNGIICGHGYIDGDLIAPEQKWPYPQMPYDENKMKKYNEKIDIWKAAKICEYFLHSINGSDWTKYRLFEIHKKCLNNNSTKRPTSSQLVYEYNKVLLELNKNGEL